jgi:transcriptional regulator with XRE-family HTH domain
MQHLRAWREILSLSRSAVVAKMSDISENTYTLDQATLAKWETGETRVTVEDLDLLAKVYGVSPDRLFFAPGDRETPELLRQAHEIITSRDPEAVKRWLASGQDMAAPKK